MNQVRLGQVLDDLRLLDWRDRRGDFLVLFVAVAVAVAVPIPVLAARVGSAVISLTVPINLRTAAFAEDFRPDCGPRLRLLVEVGVVPEPVQFLLGP